MINVNNYKIKWYIIETFVAKFVPAGCAGVIPKG
jgi:hypothetical protein